MDARSSKHTALAIPGDKMLTCILKFHMSRNEHFGSDMFSVWLKAFGPLAHDMSSGANDSDQLSNGLGWVQKGTLASST